MKKSIFKRVFSVALSMVLVLGIGTIGVSAEEGTIGEPKVVYLVNELDVPEGFIEDVMRENPEATNITVMEVGENCQSDREISPRFAIGNEPTFTDISRTTTKANVLVSDQFVESCAKGMTFRRSSSWSYGISASATGEIDIAKLNLKSKLTAEYTTEFVFTGPPEGGRNNTREYRVKFYENQGNYTAVLHSNNAGSGGMFWKNISGSWTEPSKYVKYSLDSHV